MLVAAFSVPQGQWIGELGTKGKKGVLARAASTVVVAVVTRCKSCLPQLVSTTVLAAKSATVRKQAADLIVRIAIVLEQCTGDVSCATYSTEIIRLFNFIQYCFMANQ